MNNVYKANRTSLFCFFHKVCLPGFINIARHLHIHQVATLFRSFRFNSYLLIISIQSKTVGLRSSQLCWKKDSLCQATRLD